jgi:hypothetical protein
MTYYVWVADLNSLCNEVPNSPVLDRKVSTAEEANEAVKELRSYNTASWHTWFDCEDASGKWDSENPCLSWLPKGE